MGYRETARNYGLVESSMGGAISTLHRWERIYLTEGAAGFMTERRGRGSKGRPRKKVLLPETESDLLDEVQRLRELNEYLEMELEFPTVPRVSSLRAYGGYPYRIQRPTSI